MHTSIGDAYFNKKMKHYQLIHFTKGDRYGKLSFIKLFNKNETSALRKAYFKCECGKTILIQINRVRRSLFPTKSCGCTMYSHGHTRNRTFTAEYNSWRGTIQRCYNKNSISYKNYGYKNIVVCERWKNSFENFLDDMGRKPTPQHSLDRINNNGNYEPSNCRWATRVTQNNNKINNVPITIDGITKNLVEWSNISGISYIGISSRLKAGFYPFDAVFMPTSLMRSITRKYTYKKDKAIMCYNENSRINIYLSVQEASRLLKISPCTIAKALKTKTKLKKIGLYFEYI